MKVYLLLIVLFFSFNLFAQKSDFLSDEIQLNSKDWEKVNIFLSNFAEVETPFFEQDKVSDELLIDFAVKHIFMNNTKMVLKHKSKTFDEKIPVENINKITEKYFGLKVKEHKTIPVKDLEGGIDLEETKTYEGKILFEKKHYLIPKNEKYQFDPIRIPTGMNQFFIQVESFKQRSIQKDDSKIFDVTGNFYDILCCNEEVEKLRYNTKVANWECESYTPPPEPSKKIKAVLKQLKDGKFIILSYQETK